jgi:hypothetical protein
MSHNQAQKARAQIQKSARKSLLLQMEREREEFERTWARPTGLRGWFTDTDHKAIAKRYIVTAFVFFVLGGIEAALDANSARKARTVTFSVPISTTRSSPCTAPR